MKILLNEVPVEFVTSFSMKSDTKPSRLKEASLFPIVPRTGIRGEHYYTPENVPQPSSLFTVVVLNILFASEP